MEVEVREEASFRHRPGDPTSLLANNTISYTPADVPVVIVRADEVLLVVLVLMIWVAAIALFFNRWGKIRMLEPYQPKFHQQPHRPSCPLAPLSPPLAAQVSSNTFPRTQKPTVCARMCRRQQRMSFSKYNVNAMTDPLSALPSPIIRRPRQNSVFVGSTMAILNPPPRRVKSAMDIQHMLINENMSTSLSGSLIPILNKDRRPSIAIDRSSFFTARHHPPAPISSHRRPSCIADRPPPLFHVGGRPRRLSCFVERPSRCHRNFISVDHGERRKSLIIQPTINLEGPRDIDATTSRCGRYGTRFQKGSRSFEQPTGRERPKPERLANSVDVGAIGRRASIPEEDVGERPVSPVFICLDETRITGKLIDSLKSSDV